MAESVLVLAAITGAHGIGGEVRLKLFAESIASLQRQKVVQVGNRQLTLESVKAGGGSVIASFAEIGDRTAAESLRGEQISVPRSSLPPLGEGEYYHADLIGMRCESRDGELLGTVVAVENFGAGDIIEIEKPDGKRTMVPFRAAIAEFSNVADRNGGIIIVDPAFLA